MGITRLLDELYKYEDYVSYDKHMGSKHGSVLTLLNNESSILISAPHSVKQLRNDKVKPADINTFGIAMILHERYGYNVVTMTGYNNTDPNFDSLCLYKSIIQYLVKEVDIKFCIDLHGAKDREPYRDIDLGTDYGSSWLGAELLHNRCLNYNGLEISENEVFTASNPRTITNFCYSKLGLPSVQMELSHTLRTTDKLQTFIKYIEYVTKDI